MPVLRSLWRPIASILTVATTLSACTSWQVQSVSPEQVLATKHPAAIRVQRVDSSSMVLDSPRIVSDSLVGAMDGRQTGVPLAHIANVAVKHGNWAMTTGLVLAITIVAAYGFVAVLSTGSY